MAVASVGMFAVAGGVAASGAYAAGTITGDTKAGNEAASAVQTLASPAGLTTAAVTRGNMDAADTAANISDVVTGGMDLLHPDKALNAVVKVATRANGGATAATAASKLTHKKHDTPSEQEKTK